MEADDFVELLPAPKSSLAVSEGEYLEGVGRVSSFVVLVSDACPELIVCRVGVKTSSNGKAGLMFDRMDLLPTPDSGILLTIQLVIFDSAERVSLLELVVFLPLEDDEEGDEGDAGLSESPKDTAEVIGCTNSPAERAMSAISMCFPTALFTSCHPKGK